MKYQDLISTIFMGKGLESPLFYAYSTGLRFELEERGDYIEAFMTAHRKAVEVCDYLFEGKSLCTVCFSLTGSKHFLSTLASIRIIKQLRLWSNCYKEHWVERDPEWLDEFELYIHHLCFKVPVKKIKNILWSALASDLYDIKPSVGSARIFDFENEIAVWPYDHRGMDVVGNNFDLLQKTYNQFSDYLLDHDRLRMDKNFG